MIDRLRNDRKKFVVIVYFSSEHIVFHFVLLNIILFPCLLLFLFQCIMDTYIMAKTLTIYLLYRSLFFATFEKVGPGAERNLRNIYFIILVEFINPSLNLEPMSFSIFTDIYKYISWYYLIGS